MILGVISDSHDNLNKLEKALTLFQESRVSHIIHAGDWIAPFTLAPVIAREIPFTGVFGNNDGDRLLLHELSGGRIHTPGINREIGGWRVLIQHTPDNVEALAVSGYFDLIIHGHDHNPKIARIEKTLVVNPGEAGGWLSGHPTAAIVDTLKGDAEIIDLE